MHVILFSRTLLGRLYGQPAAERITTSILALAGARRRVGLPSLLLDVERGLAEYDLPGVTPTDPEAISGQLIAFDELLRPETGGVTSALLIGGPAALPFHLCPNPFPDSDALIPADYPYGARRSGQLLSDWPVGRLPGGRDPRLLLRFLALAAALHLRGPDRTAPAFGYCAAAWQPASALVYSAIDDPARLTLSPPAGAERFDRARLDLARRIYCNLHGVRARPIWYGQADDRRGQLSVALRPEDLDGLRLIGAVVVSECCYGAYSTGYDLDESMATRFLARGAACFVGATALSYGPAGPPLLGADLLAWHMLAESLRPGVRAGVAFQRARELTIRDTLQHQGFLDDDDTKTLTQFVLYGDPCLAVGPPLAELQSEISLIGS